MHLLLHVQGGWVVDAFGAAHPVRLESFDCANGMELGSRFMRMDGRSLRLVIFAPQTDTCEVYQFSWPPEDGVLVGRRAGGGRVRRPMRALTTGCALHARDARRLLLQFRVVSPGESVARITLRCDTGEETAGGFDGLTLEEHARGLDGAEARAARAASARFAAAKRIPAPDPGARATLRPRARTALFDALTDRLVDVPPNTSFGMQAATLLGREGWCLFGHPSHLRAPPRLGGVVLPHVDVAPMVLDDCSCFLLARNDWTGRVWHYRTGTLEEARRPVELDLDWPRQPYGGAEFCAHVDFESAAAITARPRRRRLWRAAL